MAPGEGKLLKSFSLKDKVVLVQVNQTVHQNRSSFQHVDLNTNEQKPYTTSPLVHSYSK